MKQWKERARRLQAGILAFAMCLSLAVTGVWAEGPTTKKGTVADGAFVADQTYPARYLHREGQRHRQHPRRQGLRDQVRRGRGVRGRQPV